MSKWWRVVAWFKSEQINSNHERIAILRFSSTFLTAKVVKTRPFLTKDQVSDQNSLMTQSSSCMQGAAISTAHWKIMFKLCRRNISPKICIQLLSQFAKRNKRFSLAALSTTKVLSSAIGKAPTPMTNYSSKKTSKTVSPPTTPKDNCPLPASATFSKNRANFPPSSKK